MKQDAWEGEDPLAAMKGVVLGTTTGLVLWVAIFLGVLKLGSWLNLW